MNTTDKLQRITVNLRASQISALDSACTNHREQTGQAVARNELLSAIIEVADLDDAVRRAGANKEQA